MNPPENRSKEASEWVGALDKICSQHFGIEPVAFVDTLLRSPNARGYILGAISEVLLQRNLEDRGYTLYRIKEKWVGSKLHHGDLYISKDRKNWFVLESKGLKSNSERWHKIPEIDPSKEKLERWFKRKKGGEIKTWWDSLPKRRKEAILASGRFNEAKVLETHFVSGTAGRAGRRIATPRKSEFHIVSLDLYLRTGTHDFIFAASKDLESPSKHSDHLKQNYLIDIMVPGVDAHPQIPPPWTRDFDKVFQSLDNPIKESDMQRDERKPGEREKEELKIKTI